MTLAPADNMVISLYDFTGDAVRPWAESGYYCVCFDVQHSEADIRVEAFQSGGYLRYENADLHRPESIDRIRERFAGRVAFMFAFPVCTDLAVSGSKHFKSKSEADPLFQVKAAEYAAWCGSLGEFLGCPYIVENPVSVLATMWRKPDYRFDPCDFGGYLPEDDKHPRWPDSIPARDAYTKKTCLWAGGGFKMPQKIMVDPVTVTIEKADGTTTTGSPQWARLGGKSTKTKNIRSATPRGFSLAAFLANAKDGNERA